MRCLSSVRALALLNQNHLRLLASSQAALPVLQHLATEQAGLASPPIQQRRQFAAEPEPELDPEEVRKPGSAKVNAIVEQILSLNLLEVADLTEIIQDRLGIQPGLPSPQQQAPQQIAAAPAAAEAAPEPEKTDFDVKLAGFDAASKIKVIKEVRGITGLGLKEAKELVEKAPVVLKPGVPKAEADEMLRKIEAVGGKVELA